jgi:hypothetical protein
MEKMTKLLTYAATAQILVHMMAVIINSRKRKIAIRDPISYGPIDERDRIRIVYLNNKIWKNDTTCVNMLRLRKPAFF